MPDVKIKNIKIILGIKIISESMYLLKYSAWLVIGP